MSIPTTTHSVDAAREAAATPPLPHSSQVASPPLRKAADQIEILGIPVSLVTMDQTVNLVGMWIARGESRHISTCDVHGLMRSQADQSLAAALRSADIVTPDGKPLVWTGRLRHGPGIGRVCGPDLMLALCERSVLTGWRHYFYGGGEGVADQLAEKLQARFPGLQVAGVECPPFRDLSAAERQESRSRIVNAGTDILWVGLGCPKQDLWMAENARDLPGVTSIGVGAAFDFHTGRIARAPRWMQDWGLEWLHRLASEPRRLWKRYLVLAPRFVLATGPATLGKLIARVFQRTRSP